MKVSASLSDAAVEVIDIGVEPAASNGLGNAASNGGGGHGLVGLAERADDVRGRIEAGTRPEGGFRVVVTVPASAA